MKLHRFIELKHRKVPIQDRVEFSIINQYPEWRRTYRDENKLNIYISEDCNKYCNIVSRRNPAAIESQNTFFIRGRFYNADNITLICSTHFFEKIKRTLRKVTSEKNRLLY